MIVSIKWNNFVFKDTKANVGKISKQYCNTFKINGAGEYLFFSLISKSVALRHRQLIYNLNVWMVSFQITIL